MSAACSDHLLALDFLTLMQVVDFQMFYRSDSTRHAKFYFLTFIVFFITHFILQKTSVFLFFYYNYLMPLLRILPFNPLFILATSSFRSSRSSLNHI